MNLKTGSRSARQERLNGNLGPRRVFFRVFFFTQVQHLHAIERAVLDVGPGRSGRHVPVVPFVQRQRGHRTVAGLHRGPRTRTQVSPFFHSFFFAIPRYYFGCFPVTVSCRLVRLG